MRVVGLVASVLGFVAGTVWLGPALIRWSPVLALVLVVVGIVIVAYFEARRDEQRMNDEVLRRFYPPRRRRDGLR